VGQRASRLIAVAFVAIALVVAGCGGSSKKSSSSSTSTSANANSGGGQSTSTVSVQQSASAVPEYLGSFAPQSGLGGKVPHETIGFVNVLGSSPAAQVCQAQFVRAAKDLGWTVRTADAQGDPAKMASDVSAMVTQHVNAIVTVSIEESAAEQGLTQAKSENIPALTFCGAITNNGAPLYAGNYAPNDAAISATVTRYMIDDLGGKGDVVAQFYSPINALARRDAVAEAMLNQAGMKIVATHQVNFTNPVQDTMQSTLAMLKAHPEAKAVLVDQDFEFPVAVQAIKQAGLNVKVYGMYGGDPAFQSLRQGGPARAIAESNPEASGWTVADQLLKYFVNKKPIDPLAMYDHPYPVALVTAGNVPAGPEANLFPDYGPLYLAQWKAEGYQF
jgi:ABC-type sugar transport system substrate-binding protein